MDVILDDAMVKKEIETFNAGDSIEIAVREIDEDELSHAKSRVRIIELYKFGRKIIAASKVEENDRKDLKVNFGFAVLLIILGSFLKVRQVVRRYKTN